MTALAERLKTRVPNLKRFVDRARSDSRTIAYDLLPVLGLDHRDRISSALAVFQPKTPDFQPSVKAVMLNAQLATDGVTGQQGPLPANVLTDMAAWFKGLPCHDPFRPHLGRFAWDKVPSDETNIGYYTWDEVIRAPHLLEIANHPDILQAAELYLGCKPVIDNIGAAWSFPGRNTAKGVQRFHRDFDCARCFKLFIYLTDMDEQSGPHVYVRGSHRSPILDSGKAQTDAQIAESFGEDAIMAITAPAGSWFLEDVYGFHKGLLPISKPRLLVAIEYNLYPSPLSPKKPILPADDRYDPYINRLFLG